MTPQRRASAYLLLTVLGFASFHAAFFALASHLPGWPFMLGGVLLLFVGTGWVPGGRVGGRNLRDAGEVLGWSDRRSSTVALAIQGFAAAVILSGAFYLFTS